MTLTPKQLTLQAILHELSGMWWLDGTSVFLHPPYPELWQVVGYVSHRQRAETVPHSLGADPDTCSDRVHEALAPLLELRP